MKPVYSVCAFLVNWTELNTPTHPSRKFIFIADIFSFLNENIYFTAESIFWESIKGEIYARKITNYDMFTGSLEHDKGAK